MYNRKLLEEWLKMPDWGDYMDKNGGLTGVTSKEGFEFLKSEYYTEVKRRIEYCKGLIKEYEDAFLNYVIAELYDRCNEDESANFLFKRSVKYYATRALEFDQNFTPAKKLLQKAQEWVDFLGGDKGQNSFSDWNISFGEENV